MRGFLTCILAPALLSLSACRKSGEKTAILPPETDGDGGNFVEFRAENRLGALPGPVYSSQADSPIHWQAWTRETLFAAKASGRLVLAVIALPQQPSYRTVLEDIESDAASVKEINDNYVPVLIDGDAVREMGILTADLCAEINSGLQLPLMVWLTPEGNPVAWIPMPSGYSGSAPDLFSQSHLMVGRMWSEDPTYVSTNSRSDQRNRRDRMSKRTDESTVSADRAADSLRALRQLTSLYDPVSRTFDESGGLFPSGALGLLSMGVRMQHVPEDLRERSRMVLKYLLDDLLSSPMFDPLDGGAFSSRRGNSWALPGFYRDCATQGRIIMSLLDAYSATGDDRALLRALGIMRFCEEHYRTPDGLFGLVSGSNPDAHLWLWRLEDVSDILTEEELPVWMAATGMMERGNLPSEIDPAREYFRASSIGFVKTAGEIAEETGADSGKTSELLESAVRKLRKVRDERMTSPAVTPLPHAVSTFRMASAYASAYRATGETVFLGLARETLTKGREAFSDGRSLKSYRGEAPESVTAGRGFVYGIALQSALDLAATTLDDEWLMWADDLATTAAEHFVSGGELRECPPSAKLMDLPIRDTAMLFDESTLGLFSMAEARLAAAGRPLVRSFSETVSKLPIRAVEIPVLHTDLIRASLVRSFGTTLVYGEGVPPIIKTAIARSAAEDIARLRANMGTEVGRLAGTDGVVALGPKGVMRKITNPKEIEDPYLPKPSK